jgi:MoaA/NifB/PqqE/SkfB family radical SAM enzyme
MELGIYEHLPSRLHLEPTTRCNARCPQCPRTFAASMMTDPRLKMVDWNPEDLKTVLEDEFFKNLKSVLINGNYGDIVMHPHPKELIEVLLNRNVYLVINTNGGALSTEFWSWLGSHRNVVVEFGIDGLKDTHHLYRRNTVFEVVMKNAKAFIDAGGDARWSMTVFKHNEHQIEECRNLAKEYKFKQFKQRPSTRFYHTDYIVLDNNMNEAYRLEPASKVADRYSNRKKSRYKKIEIPKISKIDINEFDNPIPKIDTCAIECLVSSHPSVYLSASGKLYPCCWTANKHEKSLIEGINSSFVQTFHKDLRYDIDFNDVTKNKISDIVKSGIFREIEKSWYSKNQFDVCKEICAIRSNMNYQYDNSIAEKINEKENEV